MSDNGLDVEGEEDLLELIRGGFLLGLVGQLHAAHPSAGTGQVEDAVAESVGRLVVRLRKDPPIRDVASYLAKVAYNTLKKSAERSADNEVFLEQVPDAATRSAEDEALRAAAVEAIKAEVRSWENVNIREVMLVYVDSIAMGEPLEAEEVADIVGSNIGEEISAASVRVWKMRGMKRLQEFVERAGLVETGRGSGGEE